MNFKTALSLTIASWLIGGLSETLGARRGLWLFESDRAYPAVFLVLASWPLEFLPHYSLSGWLAGESLIARRRVYHEPRQYEPLVHHPMYAGGRTLTVVAVRADDKFAALDRVLAETGKSPAEFAIMIKPNFMFMYAKDDHTTYTDPALVEYLIRRLSERGYSNLCIVEAQSAYGNFLYNRDVVTVAQHIGYSGKGYRIVDLTLEMVQAFGRPEIRLIGDASVYRPWENVPKEYTDIIDTVEESYGIFNMPFAISSSPFVDNIFPPKPQTRLMRLLRPLGVLIGILSPYKRTNVATGAGNSLTVCPLA